MDKKLRHLKESMDDTVLRDIHASVDLKRRIKKQITKMNNPTLFSHSFLKKTINITLSIVAIFVSLLLIYPFSDIKQTDVKDLHIKQEAMLNLQFDLIDILIDKSNSELNFYIAITDPTNNKDKLLREQAYEMGMYQAVEVNKIDIPESLNEYERELRNSLSYLSNFLLLKADYINSYGKSDLSKTFSKLEMEKENFIESIGKVYDELGMQRAEILIEAYPAHYLGSPCEINYMFSPNFTKENEDYCVKSQK